MKGAERISRSARGGLCILIGRAGPNSYETSARCPLDHRCFQHSDAILLSRPLFGCILVELSELCGSLYQPELKRIGESLSHPYGV